MKTIAFTPTCKNKASNERGFITPPQHSRGGYPTSAGGFYFGIFALMGAIHHKEVAITKMGINLYSSKIAFQILDRKEYI